MYNDFQNSNQNDNNNRKKYSTVISIIVLLAICLAGTYFITDRLTNPKYNETNKDMDEDKTVYNNTNTLDDNLLIVLMTDDKIDKQLSLKEFKKENDINVDINQQFVVNYYTSDGYTVDVLKDDKVIFKKESQTVTLQPNKYYLGEKDGFFAIYKTDSTGKPFIEEEKDVYINSKTVKSIPENDQEEIKSFKHSYDTKDEAKEMLSGYIS